MSIRRVSINISSPNCQGSKAAGVLTAGQSKANVRIPTSAQSPGGIQIAPTSFSQQGGIASNSMMGNDQPEESGGLTSNSIRDRLVDSVRNQMDWSSLSFLRKLVVNGIKKNVSLDLSWGKYCDGRGLVTDEARKPAKAHKTTITQYLEDVLQKAGPEVDWINQYCKEVQEDAKKKSKKDSKKDRKEAEGESERKKKKRK